MNNYVYSAHVFHDLVPALAVRACAPRGLGAHKQLRDADAACADDASAQKCTHTTCLR